MSIAWLSLLVYNSKNVAIPFQTLLLHYHKQGPRTYELGEYYFIMPTSSGVSSDIRALLEYKQLEPLAFGIFRKLTGFCKS